MKKGAGRKMVWSGATKRVWDRVLELKAYEITNTVLDIYILQGEVPDTVMLGWTSDTSQFFEHRFYDWVMFRDKPIQ